MNRGDITFIQSSLLGLGTGGVLGAIWKLFVNKGEAIYLSFAILCLIAVVFVEVNKE